MQITPDESKYLGKGNIIDYEDFTVKRVNSDGKIKLQLNPDK